MNCFGGLHEVLMRSWVINEPSLFLGMTLIGLRMEIAVLAKDCLGLQDERPVITSQGRICY